MLICLELKLFWLIIYHEQQQITSMEKILLYFGFNSKSGLNLCAEIKIEFFVSFFSRMCFCL